MKKCRDLDSALIRYREMVAIEQRYRRDSMQAVDPISADDFDSAPLPPKPYSSMTEDEFEAWYEIATKFPEDWIKMDSSAARMLYDAFVEEWRVKVARYESYKRGLH